ncbi:2-succinyl-5-enolpyruvyl-6-hydroxy-3-cyclohexene-1-carboxylic-acid synthase [Motiliproteus sp. SC1-56]|uniref:2-succinyl-5-enolpyruvyl-6-hydroxy-3- cyclohexene-1-carboxylic-acid synthase n=1 Tax=Motiliproteus sp. SC1-56 TaxID=2799565 RepID=UPI001A8E57A7|nr:2-succinyl-5-enolpyruvyl-6-hydroxy-3-cyclohexene-1-carboxylic-acid synthase [Motiliproteus sp. SC1-56]
MFPPSHPDLNQLWAELLLEELERRGIRHLCLAPGSRSTPLVLAAARRPSLTLHHHLDERGLGFLALGIAKQSDATVAVITTSGTAVANLYPALIEASQTGVRLVLLTADRPPRLQDCGANQAIRQTHIFSDYPRRVLRLEPPSRDTPPESLLAELGEALDLIAGAAGGVVQINCRFDEPLYPGSELESFSRYLASVAPWCEGDQPWTQPPPAPRAPQPDAAAWQVFKGAPGVIVVGAQVRSFRAIKALAQALGWPLIADIQSPLKFDAAAISQADQLLAAPAGVALRDCRHLLQFGGRLVSKALQRFIDEHRWERFWVVHPGDYPLAPGRNQSAFFAAEADAWCQDLMEEGEAECQLPLAELNRHLAVALHQQLSADERLTEPTAVHRLLQLIPEGAPLVAGNSLAIRLLDMIAGTATNAPRILANRGASGIEGLTATAAGVAKASARPVTLLVGDTAFLYDLNSLILLRELDTPLIIVVLNNDGGGIFRLLPVPDQELLKTHYQRPHGLDFAAGCAQFGVDYRCPRSLAEFAADYRDALQRRQHRVIELRCDADDSVAFIRGLTAAYKSS